MAIANDRESSEARIVRAVLRLARAMRRLASAAELTGGALALVATLSRKAPLSAVELARAEGLQPQSLSRLLVRLEADALIERTIDPEDRRRHVITLTARGRDALSRAMSQRREWLRSVIAERLSEPERASLLAAAEIMLRIADTLQESDHAVDRGTEAARR